MNKKQLDKTLKDHALYVIDQGGKRADLLGANLQNTFETEIFYIKFYRLKYPIERFKSFIYPIILNSNLSRNFKIILLNLLKIK